MADSAAVENKKTIPVIIVEKVPADEAPAEATVKKATEAAEESSDVVSTTAQNGNGAAAVASENGDCEADAVVSEEAVAAVEAPAEADAAEIADETEETVVPAEEAAVAENGDGKVAVDIAEEANGDAVAAPIPSTPTAEALKRKAAINADDEKTDEKDAATPEKKAKLDEISKEELQNGSEKSEVAA